MILTIRAYRKGSYYINIYQITKESISYQCCACWKPNRMKIFQVTQKNLTYLGVSWYYSIQKYPINRRNLLAFSIFSLATILDCTYLFHVAVTFNEYANSVYTCLSIILATVVFVIVTCRMRMFFNCLNQIEKISNESESIHWLPHWKRFKFKNVSGLRFAASKAMYEKTNSNVEKWCKILITAAMTAVLQSVMFSKFILSYFLYFATDLGRDAFQMPFPTW